MICIRDLLRHRATVDVIMPCNERAPDADEQDCSESDYGSGAVAVGRSNL